MRLPFRRLYLSIFLFALVLTFDQIAFGQQTPLPSIKYYLSMSKPTSHLFEVSIEVGLTDEWKDKDIQFQMPKWSPGRYAVFDFAKNVQEFQAAGGVCPAGAKCKLAERKVTRVDDQTWSVPTDSSTGLTISYKVFGNDLSGTFSQLDERHANFNGGSIFMYVVGHKADPVQLTIESPSGWRTISGRTTSPNQSSWQFANWDIMIDTPTEIAPDWTKDDFEVGGKKYHVVIHSFGSDGGKRGSLVKDIEKIVRTETGMWGPPEFDEYTFLIHFAGDDHSGDGMEHLTSTQIIEPGLLSDTGVYDETLGTVAHEFFHVWNVKRLRPFELGPWDFTRPLNTRGLWVAEGFTNYYGHLMLRRAGLWDGQQFLRRESGTIYGIESSQGSHLMSAEDSSLSAPFLDDAPHAQNTNLQNTAISYYPKGELIGMVLDLIIRGRTKGKVSLDDVMRKMYDEFYLKSPNNSYYLRGRGYHTEDLQRVASEVSGFDLAEFFDRYIRGVEVLPYDEAFGYVGLRLVKNQAKEPFNAGMSVQLDDPRTPVIENVQNNSVAENAGLQKGDAIVELGGKPATKAWRTALAGYKTGQSVPVTVKRDRRTIKVNLVLGEPERYEYRIVQKDGASAEAKALRAAWLSGK
jgi:predicted metalloprotease with PDZ domain